MYPLVRSRRYLLAVILCWLLCCLGLGILIAQMTVLRMGEVAMLLIPPMALEMFVVSSSWYLCISEPLRMSRMMRVIVIHALTACMTALLWLFVLMGQAYLLDHMYRRVYWSPEINRLRVMLFLIGILLYAIASMIHYLVLSIQRLFAAEQEVLTRKLALSDAELRALRATIHPHFLFNSLTSLSSLIQQDGARARELCLRLSDFMRYSLRYQQDAIVTLRDELAHAENYLKIEHIRWEDRLHIVWAVDERQSDFPMPSLVLFPLVENAVKHGIQQRLEGGTITITVNPDGPGIRIEIANPLPDADAPKPVGERIGLKTLRSRLDNYYHGEANIWLGEDGGKFCARLYIPRHSQLNERSAP